MDPIHVHTGPGRGANRERSGKAYTPIVIQRNCRILPRSIRGNPSYIHPFQAGSAAMLPFQIEMNVSKKQPHKLNKRSS